MHLLVLEEKEKKTQLLEVNFAWLKGKLNERI
jgi:hypothetical protein